MKALEIEERLKEHRPGYIGRFREFSILIPLVQRNEEITLLYQVRGANIKRQPGEISFPGGAMEPDETYMECAIRETCEELGIKYSDIYDIHEIARNHTWGGDEIHVFAGFVDGSIIDGSHPSPVEVAELFEVPLEWLMENEPELHPAGAIPGFLDGFDESILGYPQGYHWARLNNEVPVYYYGDKIIWGITGRITKYFIEIFKNEVRE